MDEEKAPLVYAQYVQQQPLQHMKYLSKRPQRPFRELCNFMHPNLGLDAHLDMYVVGHK